MTDPHSADEPDDFVVEYRGVRIGRAIETTTVPTADGERTIEAGALGADLVTGETLLVTRDRDGWRTYYSDPTADFPAESPSGESVTYDLLGIVDVPEPMAASQYKTWLRDHPDTVAAVLDGDGTDSDHETDALAETVLARLA